VAADGVVLSGGDAPREDRDAAVKTRRDFRIVARPRRSWRTLWLRPRPVVVTFVAWADGDYFEYLYTVESGELVASSSPL